MTDVTTNCGFRKSAAADLYATTRSDLNWNWDTLDPMVHKCTTTTSNPTSTDDTHLQYSAGSIWVDTAHDQIFICENPLLNNAVWRCVYNAGNPLALTSAWVASAATYGITAATFTSGVADGTAPFSATSTTVCPGLNASAVGGKAVTQLVQEEEAGDIGAYSFTAANFISEVATNTAPYACTSTTLNTHLNADLLDTLESTDFCRHADFTGADQFIVGTGNGTAATKTLQQTKDLLGVGTGSVAVWNAMPGTPTRTAANTFTITDSSILRYDLVFKKGTILTWKKTNAKDQFAMVLSAVWDTNVTTTITTLGNDLNDPIGAFMYYCIHKAMYDTFIVPGTLPLSALGDISKTIWAQNPIYIFGALPRVRTGGTAGTDQVFDIHSSGTTIFDTKPLVSGTATKGVETVCNCLKTNATTEVAEDAYITLEYDSGHASAPGADAYVTIYWMPIMWRYMT